MAFHPKLVNRVISKVIRHNCPGYRDIRTLEAISVPFLVSSRSKLLLPLCPHHPSIETALDTALRI